MQNGNNGNSQESDEPRTAISNPGERADTRGIRRHDGGLYQSGTDAEILGESTITNSTTDGSLPEDFSSEVVFEATYIGPVPHPDILNKYSESHREIIMQAYAQGAKTRNQAIERLTKSEAYSVTAGAFASTLVLAASTVAAIALAFQGKEAAALFVIPLLLGGVAKLVKAFKAKGD